MLNLRRIHIVFIIMALWTLAIVLPNINFSPAEWEVIKKELVTKRSSLEILGQTLIIIVTIFLGGLLGLSFWKILTKKKRKKEPVQEIYDERIKVPWLIYFLIVLLFGTIGGELWHLSQQSPFIEEKIMDHSYIDLNQEKVTQVFSEDSRRSKFEWTIFKENGLGKYFFIISLIIAICWIILLPLRKRSKAKEDAELNIPQIAARAIWDLEKGTDLIDVVLRCYRVMCAIMQQEVTLRPEMTAREFAQHLQEAGVRVEEVRRLTLLFEKVRYGGWAANSEEKTEALSLLQTIKRPYGKVTNDI